MLYKMVLCQYVVLEPLLDILDVGTGIGFQIHFYIDINSKLHTTPFFPFTYISFVEANTCKHSQNQLHRHQMNNNFFQRLQSFKKC